MNFEALLSGLDVPNVDWWMSQRPEALYLLGKAISDQAKRHNPLIEALKKAEAALADIGDGERLPGDDVAWCEARAAEALPVVRAALLSSQCVD